LAATIQNKFAALIFPHQLFEQHPALENKPTRILLIEDSLFFGDANTPLNFHRIKLAFHIATMNAYEKHLRDKGYNVERITASVDSQILSIFKKLKADSITEVRVADVHDFLLEKRLKLAAKKNKINLDITTTPYFINSTDENTAYRTKRKRWFMADYYKFQRTRLEILMDGDEPVGGKWSFDESNRKKIPKTQRGSIPYLPLVEQSEYISQAISRVNNEYPDNPGELSQLPYPVTHADAKDWLDNFLHERFELFGIYEDAMLEGESSLYHSLLTPLLNVGLLTPQYVVEQALVFARENDILVGANLCAPPMRIMALPCAPAIIGSTRELCLSVFTMVPLAYHPLMTPSNASIKRRTATISNA